MRKRGKRVRMYKSKGRRKDESLAPGVGKSRKEKALETGNLNSRHNSGTRQPDLKRRRNLKACIIHLCMFM